MRLSLNALALIGVTLAATGTIAWAQRGTIYEDAEDGRAALRQAQSESAAAEKRAEGLEREARAAVEAADKTAAEAAALAARIQQAEAGIAAAEARLGLIEGNRGELRARLAERQEPLVRLTGALQKITRRPLALSILRPGSLRDTVYLRAMLTSTLPEIRSRTAALRSEMERSRALEREAQQALAALRGSEETLAERRTQLARLETRQRLVSREAGSTAARESERALALAEEARDLDGLVDRLDAAGSLRAELAALPGPVLRPAQPSRARVDTATSTPTSNTASLDYALPVAGRILSGFGTPLPSGETSRGIALSPVAGAQIVAPSAGRVAFAGPYRGYGRIVIIEHPGGWTSLVTGLARIDVQVGEDLRQGAPLGVASQDRPMVGLELRRGGDPVNPLGQIR